MGEILLLTFTFAAAWLAIGTELLSAIHALTLEGIAWFWGISLIACLGIVLLFFRRKIQTLHFPVITKPDKLTSFLIAVVILIVMVLLVVALVSPPNTNDSLSYHMARVATWAQQGSLDYYPTPIARQLWMPPWAEWAVLHLYLLTGNDQLVNLVQWLAMLGSVLLSARLGYLLSGNFKARAASLSALFCATLPMGALQATSTQTDYVTAFWVVCLAYWSVLAHQRYPLGQRLTTIQWAGLACSAGLGMLTKGTYYAFAAPFLIWVLVSMLRAPRSRDRLLTAASHWRSKLTPVALALVFSIVIIVSLNAGTWLRNLNAYHHPFGPGADVARLTNEVFNPSVLVSNLIRNSTLHLATRYGDVNGPIRVVVELIHQWINLDTNDPRTSLDEYRVKRSRHEDYAGNPWHFILSGASLLVIASRCISASQYSKKGSDRQPDGSWSLATVYALALIAGFLIFSGLYKWQTTGSRLQLSLFIAASPLVGFVFAQPVVVRGSPASSWQKHLPAIVVCGTLIIAGYPSILSNPSRPLIVDHASAFEHSILVTPRSQLLFASTQESSPGYFSLAIAIYDLSSCEHFGMILDSHDKAYPFWALQQPNYALDSARPITWIYLNDSSGQIVSSSELEQEDTGAQICAVVCSICSQSQLIILTVGNFTAESKHAGQFILYRRISPEQ